MGIAIPFNLLISLVKSSFVGSELGNFTPIPKKEDDTKTTRKNLGYPQKLVVYYHCPYESFHFFAKLYGFFIIIQLIISFAIYAIEDRHQIFHIIPIFAGYPVVVSISFDDFPAINLHFVQGFSTTAGYSSIFIS